MTRKRQDHRLQTEHMWHRSKGTDCQNIIKVRQPATSSLERCLLHQKGQQGPHHKQGPNMKPPHKIRAASNNA